MVVVKHDKHSCRDVEREKEVAVNKSRIEKRKKETSFCRNKSCLLVRSFFPK